MGTYSIDILKPFQTNTVNRDVSIMSITMKQRMVRNTVECRYNADQYMICIQ